MIKRLIIISLSMFLLSGCAALSLPPFFTYLGYTKTAADAVSYMATEKTLTDHAISAALEKDCVMFRALSNENICVNIIKEGKNLKTEW